MHDKQCHSRSQMDSSSLGNNKVTDLEVLVYLCVCLPSLLSSHGAAGYCQDLKCLLSSSLPQAVEVQKVGGGLRGGCVSVGFACHLSRHQEDNILTFNPY